MEEIPQLKQIIQGCLNGDRKSQHAIYKMFYGKMKAVCLRYTRDQDTAQDVLQEGFIKVFNNMERFTGVGSFEGWVRRIMVNMSIDRFRKSKTDILMLGQDTSSEEFEDEIDVEIDEYDKYDFKPEEIIEAMYQLSPAYQTVFNLYVFENYTHMDIAEALGISVGTSKSNFAKAKRNLKKILLTHNHKKANEQDFYSI
ncbi:MAG: RNA polymerase sigma factor [Flavobacteriales bacterium]|nr:RNA polymerase sigma factor [Flavobacteriales bacterium]